MVVAPIVDIDVMVGVEEIQSHDDGQNKETQSEHHSRHSPALGLPGCLHGSTVVSPAVQPVYLHTEQKSHNSILYYICTE